VTSNSALVQANHRAKEIYQHGELGFLALHCGFVMPFREQLLQGLEGARQKSVAEGHTIGVARLESLSKLLRDIPHFSGKELRLLQLALREPKLSSELVSDISALDLHHIERASVSFLTEDPDLNLGKVLANFLKLDATYLAPSGERLELSRQALGREVMQLVNLYFSTGHPIVNAAFSTQGPCFLLNPKSIRISTDPDFCLNVVTIDADRKWRGAAVRVEPFAKPHEKDRSLNLALYEKIDCALKDREPLVLGAKGVISEVLGVALGKYQAQAFGPLEVSLPVHVGAPLNPRFWAPSGGLLVLRVDDFEHENPLEKGQKFYLFDRGINSDLWIEVEKEGQKSVLHYDHKALVTELL